VTDAVKVMIDEARAWIGTPFVHQGRTKGRAVDCLGLMIAVAKAAGFADNDFDEHRYGPCPISKNMGAGIAEHMNRLPAKDARPGDWLWITYGIEPTHLAMLTEQGTIIHARPASGKGTSRVVEHRLTPQYRAKARAAWRFKALRRG